MISLKLITVLICVTLVLSCNNVLQHEKDNLMQLKANQSCVEDCCNILPKRPPMTYIFYQNSGRFIGGSGEYAINTLTYSGQGAGYLNPDYQCVVNTGPLPASTYQVNFCKNVMHETVPRPCSYYLDPQKPQQMCGRNDFFIHGCDCCTPGDDTNPPSAGCSAGCIVMSYINRKKIRVGDTLVVKHYEPKQLNLQSWKLEQQSKIEELLKREDRFVDQQIGSQQ